MTPSLDAVWIGSQRVAEITGIHQRKVLRMANAGRIPAYRARGERAWRFRSQDISRWLDEGFNGTTAL